MFEAGDSNEIFYISARETLFQGDNLSDYISASLLFWSTVVTAVKSFKREIHPANFSTTGNSILYEKREYICPLILFHLRYLIS